MRQTVDFDMPSSSFASVMGQQENCRDAVADYAFFRSKMGVAEKEQDALLEKTMLFFELATADPVLLSMLVLVRSPFRRALNSEYLGTDSLSSCEQ